MIRAAAFLPAVGLPQLRLGWGPGAVSAVQASALALPVLIVLAERGAGVLLATLVASVIAELAFALIRRRPLSWHGLPTAMAVAVMVPAGMPLSQPALAAAFGVVLSDLVFGGRGYGFVSAAVASLAFLVFSFPGIALIGGDPWIAAATVPGGALLLATGLISWRVLVPFSAAALATLWAQGGDLTTAPALVFGLVFLTADPVGAAATNPGRWAYGALVGALAVALAGGQAAALTTSLVFATLIGSIFAPLFDHLAMLWFSRRRRHG